MTKTIAALILSNTITLATSGVFYFKYQANNSINDDVQRDLAIGLREERAKTNLLTLQLEELDDFYTKSEKEVSYLKANCIESETYHYALSYAASLELGVRDVDAYSYLESFDIGAILEARDIAAENFNLKTFREIPSGNNKDRECYGLEHLDITICQDIKTKKCTNWVGGDYNTPDYNCDLFKLYKSKAGKRYGSTIIMELKK